MKQGDYHKILAKIIAMFPYPTMRAQCEGESNADYVKAGKEHNAMMEAALQRLRNMEGELYHWLCIVVKMEGPDGACMCICRR